MLSQHVDMIPPWEKFPTYERFSIGWRMGEGEDYVRNWHKHIGELPQDFDSRLKCLRRHRAAPLNWAPMILSVLHPKTESEAEYGCTETEKRELLNMGLVEHDAAYHTWLGQQSSIVWPWTWQGSETPEMAMRYQTRELWFFSRQLAGERKAGNIMVPKLPRAWQRVEVPLMSGSTGTIEPNDGLLALAKMFCAGSVKLPWTLGLSPRDFKDSFDMDMGYSDAFRLWIMSAFDDDLFLRELLQAMEVPPEWAGWIDEHAEFG